MSVAKTQDSSLEDGLLAYVLAPSLDLRLCYDPTNGLLGSGTVGEVYKAHVVSPGHAPPEQKTSHARGQCFALKLFRNRPGESHFQRELIMLEALAIAPHRHIVHKLDAWASEGTQHILFPLALGDLWHFFREKPLPDITPRFTDWLMSQLEGLADALSYVHSWRSPNASPELHRIGFHHDLKPTNILIFEANNAFGLTWKMSDFGSGIVAEMPVEGHNDIYNPKPSTGDPTYTAPEYVHEGRVSRPKDVWSLGCIFLESLIWALEPCRTRLDDFQEERMKLQAPDQWSRYKPMYFYQNAENGEGVDIHPAVLLQCSVLASHCRQHAGFEDILETIRGMLTVVHTKRLLATEVRGRFQLARACIPDTG